jgi:hypothetical protein
MATSHDGGVSFTKDRLIIPAGPGYFGITGVSRSNGFPQIGIDPHGNGDKKRGGKLYVAWSDYSNGDVDVFVSSSADYGKMWSAPVRVNTDAIHNGNDQFFQWMAVDPQSSAVNLVFYDRRTDNEETTVTLARSIDGGKTFQNYVWDPDRFNAEGDFLGDYLAITAYGNKVFGAWAHQTSAEAKTERGKKTRTVLRVGTADFN